jgi:hypothetical protein
MAIRKQQHRVTMNLPEAAQQGQRGRRQGHQAILVALGIADMHALTFGVDIAHLQAQALAEAQTQAVDGEKENPVTEHMGGQEKLLSLFHANNIRQALDLGRLDQIGGYPGFAQHMGIIELEAVQIELDRAPGMRCQQIGKIIGQLRFGQVIDLFIEILTDTPNGTGVSLYRLGLEPFELKVFKMGLIIALEIGCG